MAKTVRWYYNGNLIGEGTEAPNYDFIWDNPPIGSHTIEGRVFEDGVDIDVSDTVNITVIEEVDTEAPSTPTGFISTDATTTSIGLSWEASTDNEGIEKYNIYRDGTFEKETISTSTIIEGLSPNTEYSFTVSAVDTSDNESPQSPSITVTTLEETDIDTSTPPELEISSVSNTGFNIKIT